MEKKIFNLKDGHEFIQLNNLLQVLQLAQTGGHAKILIQNEEIKVNNTVETRVRKKLFKEDIIRFENLEVTIK